MDIVLFLIALPATIFACIQIHEKFSKKQKTIGEIEKLIEKHDELKKDISKNFPSGRNKGNYEILYDFVEIEKWMLEGCVAHKKDATKKFLQEIYRREKTLFEEKSRYYNVTDGMTHFNLFG